jgi:succinoglycan biosynthesis transport protein ExoP
MTQHGPRLLPFQNFAMTSSNHDDSTAGFRGFLPTILRGKWIITAFTALTLLLTMYFIFGVSVSKYRATAVVMLKTQRDNVIDLQGVVSGLSGERSSVNSEVEVLRARGLMAEVVDRLNLLSDPEFNTTLSKPDLKSLLRATLETAFSRSGGKPSNPTPMDQVKRQQDVAVNTPLTKVIVRNIPQSLVFEITVETTDPAKSALIADTIVDLYILNQIRVKFE